MTSSTSSNDDWEDAVVTSFNQNIYFFVGLKKGWSAVLRKWGNRPKVGDFFRVRIEKNPSAKPEHGAQNIVLGYVKIAPLAKTSFNGQFVEFVTTAEVYSRSQGGHLLLKNDSFGGFVDLRGVIDAKIGDIVEFKFKIGASPLARHASINIPTQFIGMVDDHYEEGRPMSSSRQDYYEDEMLMSSSRQNANPALGKKHIGLVGSSSSGSSFVYSPDFQEDLIIHPEDSPIDENLIGKWVTFTEVHEKQGRYSIRGRIELTDPLFPTKIWPKTRVPVVLVDGVYKGDQEQDGSPILCHDILGPIVDDKAELCPIRRQSYSIWVARHKRENHVSRWRVWQKGICEVLQSERQEHIGFIGNTLGGSSFVYSPDFQKDLIIHQEDRPVDDLLGEWVTFYEVGQKKGRLSVIGRIELAGPLLPTKIWPKANVPVVLVDVVYKGDQEQDGSPMLYHDLLGPIVDDNAELCPIPRQSYSIWAARHKRDNHVSRWKVWQKGICEDEHSVESWRAGSRSSSVGRIDYNGTANGTSDSYANGGDEFSATTSRLSSLHVDANPNETQQSIMSGLSMVVVPDAVDIAQCTEKKLRQALEIMEMVSDLWVDENVRKAVSNSKKSHYKKISKILSDC